MGGRQEDRIITRRKGSGSFTVTVIGREAHAGNEHAKGINAIHALSQALFFRGIRPLFLKARATR